MEGIPDNFTDVRIHECRLSSDLRRDRTYIAGADGPCLDVKMYRCTDLPAMYQCPNVPMYRCADVPVPAGRSRA